MDEETRKAIAAPLSGLKDVAKEEYLLGREPLTIFDDPLKDVMGGSQARMAAGYDEAMRRSEPETDDQLYRRLGQAADHQHRLETEAKREAMLRARQTDIDKSPRELFDEVMPGIRKAEQEMVYPRDYISKVKKIVGDYITRREGAYTFGVGALPEYELHIVWFCKTLQNWKALVTTNLPDGLYYEVTYNGDKRETYLDVYAKQDNVVVSD